MINLSNLTPLNVFLIWLSFFSLSLFVISVFYSRRNQKKLEEAKDREEKRWEELELKAQKDYQEVIETANNKAQEIILQATELKADTTNNFQSSIEIMLEEQEKLLKEASLALSKKFQEQANAINSDNVEMLSNIYKDIELNAKTSYSEYKELIKKQTFEAEAIAQEKIKEEYAKLETEIKDYREKSFQKIDDDMYKILLSVSKTVIGKALTLEEQEELIINALNQAKKENMI